MLGILPRTRSSAREEDSSEPKAQPAARGSNLDGSQALSPLQVQVFAVRMFHINQKPASREERDAPSSDISSKENGLLRPLHPRLLKLISRLPPKGVVVNDLYLRDLACAALTTHPFRSFEIQTSCADVISHRVISHPSDVMHPYSWSEPGPSHEEPPEVSKIPLQLSLFTFVSLAH